MKTSSQGKLSSLLFNPFRRVAGAPALGLGLMTILLGSWIGSLSDTHFDGVLDTHTGSPAPLWFFLAEGIVDWLAMGLALLATGRLATRSEFRTIDLLGTQALARWPMLLAALACLAPGYRRFTQHLVEQVQKAPQDLSLAHPDAAWFFLVVLATLAATVWMVMLMYRSFSLCANLRGGRAAVLFTVALIVAEAVSKIALVLLAKRL